MRPGEVEERDCDVSELRVESRGLSQVIRGYAIVFKRLSLPLSSPLGVFREQIAPEAIDRTLSEQIDLRALFAHDDAQVLGRLSAGTLRVAADGHGLAVEIDAPRSQAGLIESIQRRDITGMSFGFVALKDDWDESVSPSVRTVKDMLVREVSVVAFPAYPQTDVAMRSWTAYRESRGPMRTDRPATVTDRLAWSARIV